MHRHARTSLLPIIGTLVGVALEIGNYENRTLANVVWVVCALLWIIWLLTWVEWGYISPERRQLNRNLELHHELGNLISEGETIRLTLLALPTEERHAIEELLSLARQWNSKTTSYLRTTHSERAAKQFSESLVVAVFTTEGVVSDSDRLQHHDLDVLTKLRRDISATITDQSTI